MIYLIDGVNIFLHSCCIYIRAPLLYYFKTEF